MALDSTMSQWFTAWAWWGAIVLASFIVLETTAILTHGWTLSNSLAAYTRLNPWTLWVFIGGAVVFGVHIWYFHGN
jgi:hypothetical protein